MNLSSWQNFPSLKKGDVVALLSLSWGGPNSFPHIFDVGKTYIEETLGLYTKEYWSTRATAEELAKDPERRAEDLMKAFQDPEIKAIFASIGGDDSLLLLPHIDFAKIGEHPKLVMGYSDTTTLLTALAAHKIKSFHGPSVMAGFAQAHAMPSAWHKHIHEMLFGERKKHSVFPNFLEYSDGYHDWKDAQNKSHIQEWKKTDGWHWIYGEKKVTGRLLGGCVEVLEFLKGTDYWPKKNLWKNAILFLETSEEKPSIDHVKRMLRNYGLQGILQTLSGLIIGRARDYSEEEKKDLEEMVRDVCVREYGCKEIVIITNFDAGHTDPQLILPIGEKIKLDPQKKSIIIASSIF